MVKLHGVPEAIVSDRDKVFLSHFWRALFEIHGTKLRTSTSYHPQTDGQTEVVNRCLEAYLRCFAGDKPRMWSQWLGWAEYWYNPTYHRTIKMTPFRALYGRDPPTLHRNQTRGIANNSLDAMLEERDLILAELQANMAQAQVIMTKTANKKRRDVEFQEGDLVFLKLQPYRMRSLAIRKNEKLAPRFFGPYSIIKRIGKVAYKLSLPEHSAIHPVFHVSRLKRAMGNAEEHQSQQLPPALTHDMELQVTPASIQGIRQKEGSKEL